MLAETFVPPPSPKWILPPDPGPLPPAGGGGGTDTCPNSRGERRRPTSAGWSACPFPLMPMWDGMCSHLTASPSCSTRSRILTPTCFTNPDVFCHLCRRHRCAQPNTPLTTSSESGQISERCPAVSLHAAQCCLHFTPVVGLVLPEGDVFSHIALVTKGHAIPPHPLHFRVFFRGAIQVDDVPSLVLV